jgi:hypothetical protein
MMRRLWRQMIEKLVSTTMAKTTMPKTTMAIVLMVMMAMTVTILAVMMKALNANCDANNQQMSIAQLAYDPAICNSECK